MKKKIIFTLNFLLLSLCLMSQKITIVGDTLSCNGNTLKLMVDTTGIEGDISYLWSSYKGNLSESGDTITIKTDIKTFSESFTVYVKGLVEKDGKATILRDLIEIKIGNKPVLETSITSFQRDANIFLELPENKTQKYTWKSPNGDTLIGNIVKFSDVRVTDFGEYNLTIEDTRTGCTNVAKHKVVQSKEEDKNVFGSLDHTEISDELFKEIKRDVPVYESSITGSDKQKNYLIAHPGYKFFIIGEIEDDYIIRFWKWDEGKDKWKDNKYLNNKFVLKSRNKNTPNDYRYFRIKKSDVDSRALSFTPINGRNGWSFTAGTVVIPIKIRRSKELDTQDNGFEFSKDIALGPFVGVKKRISKYKPYFLDLGLSVGISSVRLTANNSDSTLTSTVQDIAAFTWAAGAVFEFDNVQIGMFIGKDRVNNNFDVNGNKGYNWAYQNKLWWSLGFGYALISRPDKNRNNPGVDEKQK